MLDSLVRVSRRAAYSHYASILACARASVRAGCIPQRAITLPKGELHSQSLYPTAQTDAGLPVGECTRPWGVWMSSHGHVWLQALPFQQFHVLFDSLSKVLFIFRSLYLCAIGLWPVFSFRRNLPPN